MLGGHPHAGSRLKTAAVAPNTRAVGVVATTLPETPRGTDKARFGDALRPFGARLLAALVSQQQPGDVLVCPLSVAAALSLAAAGSLPASPVGLALDALLGCGPSGVDAAAWLAAWGGTVAGAEVHLLVANSVWLAANVKPSYAQAVAAAFGAHVAPLQGAAPINAWVSAATRGVIPNIIGPLGPNVRFVLVNAVHFKASWSTPFSRSATVLGSFKRLDGSGATPCALMFRSIADQASGTVVAAAPGRGTVVTLPYGSLGRFRAVFVLPEAHGTAALDALLEPVAVEALLALAQAPGSARLGGLVQLYVPRFRAKFGATDLAPALTALGLGAAFDARIAPPCFAPMVDDEPVCIDKVLHKVVVDVNEEGTEAAAASAVVGFACCYAPPPCRVVFDRPFALFILDMGSLQPLLLFGGRVVSPSFDTSGTNGAYVEPRRQATVPTSVLPPPVLPPPPLRAPPLESALFTSAPGRDSRGAQAFTTRNPGLLLLRAAESGSSIFHAAGMFGLPAVASPFGTPASATPFGAPLTAQQPDGGGLSGGFWSAGTANPAAVDFGGAGSFGTFGGGSPQAGSGPIACVQLLKGPAAADVCIFAQPGERANSFTTQRSLFDASVQISASLQFALTNLCALQRISVQLTACDANGYRTNPFASPTIGEWPLDPGQSVVTVAVQGMRGTHVAIIVKVHTRAGDWSITGAAWAARIPSTATKPQPGGVSAEPFVPEPWSRDDVELARQAAAFGTHTMAAPVAVLALL